MSSYILSSVQMKAADKYAVEKLGTHSAELMETAANGLLLACERIFENLAGKNVAVLCGKGNNGGDGFALCRLLLEKDCIVSAIGVLGLGSLSEDSLFMKNKLPENILYDFTDSSKSEHIINIVRNSDLVVDCVFGTGFSGEIPDALLSLFSEANKKNVLACDIPSGINSDTGLASAGAIRAFETVAFAAVKPCHYLYPSKEFCGNITIWDIGIAEAVEAQNPNIEIITEQSVKSLIRPRPENSHKGTFGSLQMFCGSKYMTGAAVLSTMAALRSGVGLVYFSSSAFVRQIVQNILFEPVYTKKNARPKANALLVGCGLGQGSYILKKCFDRDLPIVVDADGLNYLAKHMHLLFSNRSHHVILTPHPAEMARLCGISTADVEKNRFNIASEFAQKYNVILVLKGHHTIIATPKGKLWLNCTGNSSLAKGGSGDVLAGFMAGLLASGYSAEAAAAVSVFLHGKTAEILSAETSRCSVLPSQIAGKIGDLLD